MKELTRAEKVAKLRKIADFFKKSPLQLNNQKN